MTGAGARFWKGHFFNGRRHADWRFYDGEQFDSPLLVPALLALPWSHPRLNSTPRDPRERQGKDARNRALLARGIPCACRLCLL
jgi:hypothetical protein